MADMKQIHAFAVKWFDKFRDKKINYIELVDHYMADDCEALGFVMDCGHAFTEKYGDAASNFEALERIIGEVTEEKVKIVQEADAIYREEIAKAGIDKGLGQYFAALTNMRSVGVMGDFRTYDYAVALRAVNTSDFMTADAAQIPWEVLAKVTNRIVNEVKGVNRVMYDCTGKPPATIEFE